MPPKRPGLNNLGPRSAPGLNVRLATVANWRKSDSKPYMATMKAFDDSVGELRAVAGAYGPAYEWSVGGRRRSRARSVAERNAVAWEELGDEWIGLAYARLSKTEQLLTATISSLDKGFLVPAAACARALLEQAVVFEHLAKTFSETVQEVIDAAPDPTVQLIDTAELEELLRLAKNGTRVREYLERGYPQQTNFMTFFQKWSKLRVGPKPDFIYEHLCDMVHPNLESELSVYRQIEHAASGRTTYRIRLGSGQPIWAMGVIMVAAGATLACRHVANDATYVGQKALEMIATARGDRDGPLYTFPKQDPRAKLMQGLAAMEALGARDSKQTNKGT